MIPVLADLISEYSGDDYPWYTKIASLYRQRARIEMYLGETEEAEKDMSNYKSFALKACKDSWQSALDHESKSAFINDVPEELYKSSFYRGRVKQCLQKRAELYERLGNANLAKRDLEFCESLFKEKSN